MVHPTLRVLLTATLLGACTPREATTVTPGPVAAASEIPAESAPEPIPAGDLQANASDLERLSAIDAALDEPADDDVARLDAVAAATSELTAFARANDISDERLHVMLASAMTEDGTIKADKRVPKAKRKELEDRLAAVRAGAGTVSEAVAKATERKQTLARLRAEAVTLQKNIEQRSAAAISSTDAEGARAQARSDYEQSVRLLEQIHAKIDAAEAATDDAIVSAERLAETFIE